MAETLEKLYALYEQKMYRLAYTIVHNVEQAEDIVQESFIKMFSHIDKLKNVENIQTKRWIMNVVKNEAIDHYRRNRRHLNLNDAVKAEPKEMKNDNVDDRLKQMIREDYIQMIFDKLSTNEKKVLRYRLVYQLSTAETAEVLAISEEAIRQRFSRAKQKAKEIMGGKNND